MDSDVQKIAEALAERVFAMGSDSGGLVMDRLIAAFVVELTAWQASRGRKMTTATPALRGFATYAYSVGKNGEFVWLGTSEKVGT